MITQTERKPWHGLNENVIAGDPRNTAGQDNATGKQVRSRVAIRAIAIAAGKAIIAEGQTKPTFKCPACNESFELSYGRRSRIPGEMHMLEYTLHCLDCIEDFHLELERTGGSKKQSTEAYIQQLRRLNFSEEQIQRLVAATSGKRDKRK